MAISLTRKYCKVNYKWIAIAVISQECKKSQLKNSPEATRGLVRTIDEFTHPSMRIYYCHVSSFVNVVVRLEKFERNQ